MFAVDFEYASKTLSDIDCIICSFNGTNDLETVSSGSNITWNTVKAPKSNKWRLYSAEYSEAYTTEFQICKNPCRINPYFSMEEISYVMRWLNRRSNYKFKVVQEGYENIYWEGSFNVQEVKHNGMTVGFDLSFTANAPYAFSDPLEYDWKIEANETRILYDISSEAGYIYPSKFEVKCLQSGDLVINNSIENRNTIVRNCSVNEIITFDGENQIITSSLDAHKIYNDFDGYNFFRIANNYENNENVITFNMKCEVKLAYSPIVKVGV